jgi:hypothetical protein
MLFGFLLAVPVSQRFGQVSANQRGLYYAAFATAAGASVCLIAPTAFHRIVWQHGEKAPARVPPAGTRRAPYPALNSPQMAVRLLRPVGVV